MTRIRSVVCALVLTLPGSACAPSAELPVVEANDNRVAAGSLNGDTLTLRLVVDMARWYPETEQGPYADVAAFAVEGEVPSVPAPMIRVRTGTVLDVTVRNALSDSTITVHGLITRPATPDSVAISPGESHRFVFSAGEPGTYMYFARPGLVDRSLYEREQLLGAFIVDEASGPADDRVLVMNLWSDPGSDAGQPTRRAYRNALAVNGLAYPFNESIEATVGEEVRWRVINGTARQHPMHLHGFYFDVDADGDPWANTQYGPADTRHVVTEDMNRFRTMNIRWTPDRDGNWLFHCHLVFHVAPQTARLRPPGVEGPIPPAHVGDRDVHMSGLALAVTVSYPRGVAAEAPLAAVRRVRLFAQEGEARGAAPKSMGYVLQRDGQEPARDSVEIPGATLILTRDEPTEIVVVNRLSEPTGLHWHGLELESYFDGVAGFSGNGARLAPQIAPQDSFTARLLLPKAGTFIYHTHLNDIEQLTSGLYGPLIVMEPGETFDPATDHIVTAAWDGDAPGFPPLLVDGSFTPPDPLVVAAGVQQRFRLINIAPAARFFYSIRMGAVPVPVRLVAKDGADLPESQRLDTETPVRLNVGETADVTVTFDQGEYELVVNNPADVSVSYTRRIIAQQITSR